jgi:hypothetical protein
LISPCDFVIGNLDVFPLISPCDFVSINKLTLILKIISQCDVKHIMMKTRASV